jgi:hypothetical protein
MTPFAVEEANRFAAIMKGLHPNFNRSDLQNATALESKAILINGDCLRVRHTSIPAFHHRISESRGPHGSVGRARARS